MDFPDVASAVRPVESSPMGIFYGECLEGDVVIGRSPNALGGSEIPDMDLFIEAVRSNEGPFMVFGAYGPTTYTAPPISLRDRVHGLLTLHWKQGSERRNLDASVPIIVVGAKRVNERALVYFFLAQETLLPALKAMRVSLTGYQRVNGTMYVISFDNFQQNLKGVATAGSFFRDHPECTVS